MTSIEKLRNTELIYGNLLETIDVGFYQVTLNGRMLSHNRAHNIILGYDPKESLESMDVREFWQDPKDREKYVEYLLNHDFTKNYICHALTKDGKKIVVELNSHLIRDEKGIPTRIDGTFIDVTEKFNLGKQLIESEEKYRLISENANDLIRVLNDKFEFEYINEGVHKRILGYNKEDLIGKTHLPFLHPEDRKHAIRSTIKNLNEGKGSYQARFKDKSGVYKWLEFAGKIFFDSKMDKKILSIARDITDRKTAERKLKESEEKYRLISETAYDLIAVIDNKFKCEYINENALNQTLGYSNTDILGKPILELTHPHDIPNTAKALVKGFEQGEGGAELRIRHKKGYWIWIEAKGKTFIDQDGNLKAIIISRDITDRKISEKRLKESEKKYREAYNRANFYKDLFAHDINNILHIIGSSSELISYHLGNSEKSKAIEDIRNIIRRQIERGAKLVSNVHTLSKLEEETVHIKPIELCNLMKNAIDFVKKTYNDRDVKIKIECDDDHLTVNANELLQAVFENILLNGVIYTENPEIELKIKLSKTIHNNKNYHKIEFFDNGIGIPDSRKEIIFKRGNRELKGTKGMGLGLSLVKRILESFNGKIWVEDKIKGDYSKGSNFVILLPELE
jgi:PAS domain S-box-containing protein